MTASKANLRMLFAHTMTEWRGWLTLGFITLSANLLSLLHPWPLTLLIDHVLSGVALPGWAQSIRTALPGADSSMGLAVYVAVLGILLFVVDSIVDALSSWSWIKTGQAVVYRFAERIFAHAQRLSVVRQARLQTGEMLATVAGDSWCVYSIASALIFTPVQSVIMIGVAFTILWQIQPTLALLSLAIAPPMTLIAAISGRLSRSSYRGQRDSEARVESHVQQTLSGISLVQSFAQEERHLREMLALTGAAIRAQRRTVLLGGIGHLFSSVVTGTGSAIVLIIGAKLALDGKLSAGELLIFLAYLGTMHGELSNLLSSYTTIQHARASLGRIASILDLPIDTQSPDHPVAPDERSQAAVELENVSFGYTPDRLVLKGATLRIIAGEAIGIVGPSGGGKSTLALLISRMVDPTGGVVSVLGVDARRHDLRNLRHHSRLVLQEPNIQSGTIAQILRFSDPDASEDRLWAALSLAGLDSFVAALPEQLETEVGEMGTTLSGGQQQRLSLARAVVGEPRILILDEPTSMLDAETEQAVITGIVQSRRDLGLTTLIISHRDSSVRDADRVYEVVAGNVRELGLVAAPTDGGRTWK